MIKMYAVGMLGSYLTQGVYAVPGPSFGGAVDIIVVQQEDGTFKSSPWYVKFGDFQGVLKRQEKIVDISVNDVRADFHMILDSKGEAYFEKEVEPDEGTGFVLPDGSTSTEGMGQEGEMESVLGTDSMGSARLQPEETLSSNALQEERWETQQEQVSGVFDESLSAPQNGRVASDENNQLRLENTEVFDGSFTIEAAHTGFDSDCMDVAKSQEQAIVSSSCDGLELENVRVVFSINNQMDADPAEASNTDFSSEVAAQQSESACMEATSTDSSLTIEDTPGLEGCSHASQDSFRTDRGSNTGTIEKEESMLHGATRFPMEGANLQSFTLSDAIVNLASDSKPAVDDDSLLVDMWHKNTFENLEADCNDENRTDVGATLGEDEVFPSFQCVTVEKEREAVIYSTKDGMNCDVQGDLGKNRDSLSRSLQSPKNEGSSDDDVPLSQSSIELSEQDSGNADVGTVPPDKEVKSDSNATNDAGNPAILAAAAAPSKWRFWALLLRWSRIEKASSLSNQALISAANVAIKSPFADNLLQKNGYIKWQQKAKVRTYVPTSAQLASLNLQDGPNKVTFASSVLGKTQVDARIYLWKWHTRIVISDVDGTITKSDVLGQVMPLVGRDWSQYGVTRLFSAIKDNGYEVLFLSARAISQAYLTRRFLLNLKQDGEALPEGPVFISPDGLIPSLYREVIRRAPHEFKISCLEGIRELFPMDVNPFYAGFGNRITDEISYLKVGIPKGKVFIINPKGEVVVNHRVDCKSYTSLHALVDEMFPPMSSHEQEEYNEWNFWKVPLPDIEDELSAISSSKGVKKVGSSKK